MTETITNVPSIWGDESEIVRAAVDWSTRRVGRHTDPLSTARSARELANEAGVTISRAGIGSEAALRIFDTVLAPSTRSLDDPMHLAYIGAAPTRAAVAFDLVTSSANIFGGLWESGAGAIFAENEALAWIVSLLGWPDSAGGCFVAGGTAGNLSALMTARENAKRTRGGRPLCGWKLACAASAHSSIRSAALALDVGVIEVPTDAAGHLTGAAVRRALEADPDIFAVVATAGTTNEGVVDDLAGIADACREFDVWMHVDGAYGGAALVASSVRHVFDGIERADSFIVDPHKWLFAPYDSCALLYRDPAKARATHAQHAGYLDHVDRDAWNPSDYALHLSRRARGLPLWFSLAVHGTDRYRDAVEQTLTTARDVAAGIRRAPHLTLLAEPELSIVLFVRPGFGANEYDTWSHDAALAGTILCIPTVWRGEPVLRLAFVNPETDAASVLEILDTLA